MEAFVAELTRPATVIAIVVGVIGIVAAWAFAWYYYRKGMKFGRIAMDVRQIQVIDRSDIGKTRLRIIEISADSEREIDDNVYVADVTIWNIGNSEIKKDNVRTPYRLWIPNAHKTSEGNVTARETKILELTPTFYSRNNANRFAVDENDGSISWEHFDPGEGFQVRLIYTGQLMREIVLEGYAVDTRTTVEYDKERSKFRDLIFKINGSMFGLLIAAYIAIFVASLNINVLWGLGFTISIYVMWALSLERRVFGRSYPPF